jgi:biotin carboxylase
MNEPRYSDPRPHVLLINTGKHEALTELRNAAPAARIRVITEPRYQHMYEPSDDVLLVDDVNDVTRVLAITLRIAAESPLDAVVSPSERSMSVGGFLRSYLSLPGINFETANLFTNKAAMKARLATRGIPVAPHRVVIGYGGLAQATLELGYPVIVKPAFGTGSMNMHVLRSPKDLSALLTSASEANLGFELTLVESFLEVVSEVTCDAIVVNGNAVFSIESRYSTPLIENVGGMLGAVTLDPKDPLAVRITALHDGVIQALGLADGVTHMEMLLTKDTLYVGEIACRPGGAGVVENAKLSRNVDLWAAFMRLSLGGTPDIGAAFAPHEIRTLLWSELPTRPGKVVFVSGEDDFVGMENLVSVDMHVRDGDTISSRMHSSSTTGLVYISLASSDPLQVANALGRLASMYRLEIEGDKVLSSAAGAIG